MNLDQALNVLAQILEIDQISNIQEIIFSESWSGKTYRQIAQKTGYEYDYIKYVGCHLWQNISNSLEVKVTKSNFKAILNHYVINESSKKYSNIQQYSMPKKRFISNIISQTDSDFVIGREPEIIQLKNWILSDRVRLINIFGMVGVGKSTLGIKLAQTIKEQFDFVFYYSCFQDLQFKNVLLEFLFFTSRSIENNIFRDLDYISIIDKILERISKNRCLFIIDSIELILSNNQKSDNIKQNITAYNYLCKVISENAHQSHLIIITRKNISYLARKNTNYSSVRSLLLSGLSCSESNKILKAQGLNASLSLVTKYSGNPLFIEYAATTIKSLFDGNIEDFIAQKIFIYGEIYRLLEDTVNQLSSIEKMLLNYLATNEKSQTLNTTIENISGKLSRQKFIESLESLQMRSLLTVKQEYIILEPLIAEYINRSNPLAIDYLL